MASQELELSIAIGGHLYPELGKSINQVHKALESLGAAGTETQEKLDAIGKINRNQLELEKMAAKLRDAIIKETVAAEKLDLAQQRGGKTQSSLTRKKEVASATVAKLRKATQELSARNIAYKKSVVDLYGPISKLKESEESLKNTREQLYDLQKKQLELNASIEKRTQSMLAAQVRITAATNIASKLRTPMEAAMEGERLNFELSTVINVDEKGKQAALARAREVGNELARTGYASFAETQDIQYALNSAGLTASLSSDAVKAVASVSKVTKGEMAQVGEVMATVYNNLGDRMAGTEAERFNRIGELLTKTQFKYQIRDFGQLGESMQKGALGIKQYNANLEQSIAALGMLNSAGLQGGEAGTAYYAMLRGFLKTAQEIPSVLKKTADDELDVVASLRELNRGMVKMDEVQRAQFMSEMFGDEGAAALVPLLDKLNELESGYKDVRDSSHGIVDKNMAEYLQLTSTRINAARESAYSLARTLGGALAPAAQTGFDGLNRVARVLGVFAEANPMLTKVIVLSAAALVGFNLMTAGILYLASGFSTLYTIGGSAIQFLRLYKAALAGTDVAALKGGRAVMFLTNTWRYMQSLAIVAKIKAITLATKAWAAIQWVLNAAMNANPIGLFITAVAGLIAILAVLYQKFDGVRNIVNGTWEILKKAGGAITSFFGVGGNSSVQNAGNVVNTQSGWQVPVYGKGGYIGSPTLAMIGDGGPEMVVPLSDRRLGLARLAEAAKILMPTVSGSNSLAATTSGIKGSNSASKAGISISYAPTIILQGGSTDRHGVSSALKTAKEDLRRMLEEIQHENARTALA